MSESKIILASVIVGSILSVMGIIEDNVYLIMAAIIISPIGAILNNISKEMVAGNLSASSWNVALLIITILLTIGIGFIGGKIAPNLSEYKIKVYTNAGFIYHALIGTLLGFYMAYITSLDKANSLAVPIVGVSIAITLMPPLADVGLRWSQSSLSDQRIWTDMKISAINAGSFFLSALLTNYLML